MASGHEIQCSKVPHAPNNAKQNRSGSESEKQNTEAEFAEGAILRPHKLEATSCEQHSFFKIDGLTPCNAQVHWLVNRLDGPTSRKELILISDLVGRSKEGVVIEIVDMAFNDGTCHTDGSDVPWQNMVQIKPCCLQDLLDGDCVHFPIGRKLLENLDSTVFVRHEPSPHIPGASPVPLVLRQEKERGGLHRMLDIERKVLDTSDEVVIPSNCLIRRFEWALSGIALAHPVLPRLSDICSHKNLSRVKVRISHVMLITEAARHVVTVVLSHHIDPGRKSCQHQFH
mmetsp:Transcript_22159/g.51448  ORF Transcript_22159/g.51448 Transcript_22159/m.51448 type:complete len:285 (+) Transcript_22159:335-1189(+)